MNHSFSLTFTLNDHAKNISKDEMEKLIDCAIQNFSLATAVDRELAVISKVEETKDPRVLVIVNGGVAYYVSDKNVYVEIFDWDNHNDDPEDVRQFVPEAFRDLAEPYEIPVVGDEV